MLIISSFTIGLESSSLNRARTTRRLGSSVLFLLSESAVEVASEDEDGGICGICELTGLPFSIALKYVIRASERAFFIRSIPASPLKCITLSLNSF
ncbi:hypothetical protein HanRHA438_Chr10g0454461 [Helianthus annuus]|nr:hypothetical protein HanRHA438_Chr10g0454461 [Helianthus annuus]